MCLLTPLVVPSTSTDCDHEAHEEEAKCGGQKEIEGLNVVLADALPSPYTVMVHLRNAHITLLAVIALLLANYLAFMAVAGMSGIDLAASRSCLRKAGIGNPHIKV